jgi:hypothetical protein
VATGNSRRQFLDAPAVRSWSPLIVGITGAQSAGKTYSALRLATGIQRVIGGEIYFADTEAGRGLHYAEYFKFRHIPFEPPHGPEDYEALIDHVAGKVGAGRGVCLLDSMSHEHDGDGGVLEQIEDFLQEKCGDDWGKRQSMNFVAQVRPKRARKQLNRRIVALGRNLVFILCYRAEEKIKPRKKGDARGDGKERSNEPELLGWQPITTSKLPFDMTVRFLLTPGCDGVPLLMPPNPAERLLIKNPRQFREWFVEGEPLSEEMGERMARWAMGEKVEPQSSPTAADYQNCDGATYKRLEERRKKYWNSVPAEARPEIEAAKKAAFDRLAAAVASAANTKPATAPIASATPASSTEESWDEASACKALRECAAPQALADLYARIDAFYGGEVPMDIEACRDSCREQLNQL